MFTLMQSLTQANAYHVGGELYDRVYRQYWQQHLNGRYRLDQGELVTRYVRMHVQWKYPVAPHV